ncbi:hypothetical protein RYX36_010628, partial [Vicia faba]
QDFAKLCKKSDSNDAPVIFLKRQNSYVIPVSELICNKRCLQSTLSAIVIFQVLKH